MFTMALKTDQKPKKRKCSYWTQAAPQQTKSSSYHIWLDALPREVRLELVANVPDRTRKRALEGFALVSETQFQAVVSCLGHKYVDENNGVKLGT